MENIQAANLDSEYDAAKSALLKLFINSNLIALIINFSLNFLGHPALKYLYLVHLLITILAILLFNFSHIVPIILTLFFIEGQGRILWGNANWTKIVFDGIVMLSIFKIFISNKKIFNVKEIPRPLIFLIIFHFAWYLLEFSNLDSVSYFAVLAASKVYIYPLLFFLGLTQIDFKISESLFQKNLNFFSALLILELILTFYQYTMKENFILQISPHYQEAMRDFIFAGEKYRPFATTYAAGAISSYFYLTVGFIFLKRKNLVNTILKFTITSALTVAIIFCQVRSALIKIVLTVLLIQIGELVFQRFKFKSLINLTIATIVIIFGAKYLNETNFMPEDSGIENIRSRLYSLGDAQIVQNARLTVPEFIKIATEKIVERPFGLGPGLTGAVGRLSIDQVRESYFLNIGMLWTNDNLFITLLVDFGVGAIFYILLLFYIPLYFIRFMIIFYRDKLPSEYNVLLVSISAIITIIIGNWGAVGLTYNPESFVFWFFAAIGFSTIAKYKRTKAILSK